MKKIGLLLCFILLITSCSNDDNQDNSKTYSLFTMTPSAISPDPQIYEAGQITWKFNFEEKTITVNTNGNDSVLLEDGNYNYTLIDHECGFDENKGMLVDGNYLGIFIRDSDNGFDIVTLTDACTDGHIAVFRRGLIL